MSQFMKPPGSPGCWGQQFTDGDQECSQCVCRDSCRSTCLSRASQPWQAPPRPASPQMAPLPVKPYLGPQAAPQAAPPPIYRPQTPTVPVMPQPTIQQPPIMQYQQPAVQYQQQYAPAASLPDPRNPNPMVPMMRPGAPAPAYYFCQYPGESTATRLGKNMALRGAESMFGELMFFFRHWTWPPRS